MRAVDESITVDIDRTHCSLQIVSKIVHVRGKEVLTGSVLDAMLRPFKASRRPLNVLPTMAAVSPVGRRRLRCLTVSCHELPAEQ